MPIIQEIPHATIIHVAKVEKHINNPYVININEDPNNVSYVKVKQGSCLGLCVVVCLMIITLPFIICDLYFGFSHQPCVNIKFNNFEMNFKTWLLTCGFMNISYILYLLIAVLQKEIVAECMTIMGKILMGLFSVVWTIIGAVLFWRYIEPNNLCDKSLTTYLWVRLIFGLVGAGTILCSRKKQD